MATYIPGTQTFMPTFQPFTPDYKFLSDVLDTKTTRYETNYKAINDVYGRLIHSDLSRLDTQQQRDQYAQELAPRLEQIAGMDLSMVQNADAAKALFKPFYEDELIVGDLVRTAALKKETAKAYRFRDSDNAEERDKYGNGDGIKRMNYEMQDFINASPEEALNMPIPKFVPNANIYAMSMDLLKNAWGEGKGMTLTQDFLENGWKIKKTNGDLLTNRVVGYAKTGELDENGQEKLQPITENIAAAFVQKQLMQDPRVLDSEWTKAYVGSREAAENGYVSSGQTLYGDAAKRAWATDRIEFAKLVNDKRLNLAKTNQDKVTTNATSWQTYKDKYGIVKGSPQEMEFLKQIMAIEAANQEVEVATDVNANTKDLDPVQINQTEDLKGLLNQAYGIVISSNIMSEISDASILYAAGTEQMEMEIDQKWKMYKQQEFDLQKKSYQHQLDLNKIIAKANADDWVNQEKEKRESEKEKKDKYWSNWLESLIQGKDFDSGGNMNLGYVPDADGDPNPNAPINQMDNQKVEKEFWNKAIPEAKWDAIKSFYQERDALDNPENQGFFEFYNALEGKTEKMSWSDAKNFFMKNQGALNLMYDDTKRKVEKVSGKDNGFMPNMAESDNFPSIKAKFDNTSGLVQKYTDGGWKKMMVDYGNLMTNKNMTIDGKKSSIEAFEKASIVKPYISPFETMLLEDVLKSDAKGLKYKDKAGTEHTLKKDDPKLFSKIETIYGINVGKLKKGEDDIPLDSWEALEYTKRLLSKERFKELYFNSKTSHYKWVPGHNETTSYVGGGPGGMLGGSKTYWVPGKYEKSAGQLVKEGGGPDQIYDSYAYAINRPYTSAYAGMKDNDGNPLEQPIFSHYQYMQGTSAKDMSAEGGTKYPIFTQYIDPLNLEKDDALMMGEIIKILNGPEATYAVGFGEQPFTIGAATVENPKGSDEARNLVIGTIQNSIKDAQSGSKAQGRNTFSIKYFSGYGGGATTSKKAAYQIQVPKKTAQTLQKYLTGETSDLITNIDKQTVTIMFDKSLDNNPKGLPDLVHSTTDYNIQKNDGVYKWTVPSTGPSLSLNVWKDNGIYYRSFGAVTFDDKTGTVKQHPDVEAGRAAPILNKYTGQPVEKQDLDMWMQGFQKEALQNHNRFIKIPMQTWKKNNPNKTVQYNIPKALTN